MITYLWDFGDGTTSTDQNPQHTFATVGAYTVTCTATDSEGGGVETTVKSITVTQPAPPPTPYTFKMVTAQSEMTYWAEYQTSSLGATTNTGGLMDVADGQPDSTFPDDFSVEITLFGNQAYRGTARPLGDSISWSCEIHIGDAVVGADVLYIGVFVEAVANTPPFGPNARFAASGDRSAFYQSNGDIYSPSGGGGGAPWTWTTGDILGIVYSDPLNQVQFFKNGEMVGAGTRTIANRPSYVMMGAAVFI